MDGANMISGIRNKVLQAQGARVCVRERNGRHKNRSQCGIIGEIYGNIFTIEINNGEYTQKVCYSYSDILTKKITINLLRQESAN